MLAIRMQRTGRKGHAMFRVIVQDSRLTPTSGKVVAQLGHYDPHTKAITLDTEKASFYLSNGAQPSDRVARLLQKEGLKLPDWVTLSGERQRAIKNADKLRKNQPKEEAAETPAEEVPAEAPAETPTDEPAEKTSAPESPAEEAQAQEPAEEAAAESAEEEKKEEA